MFDFFKVKKTYEIISKCDRLPKNNDRVYMCIDKKACDYYQYPTIHIKIGPAPEGYRYKKFWPMLILKNVFYKFGHIRFEEDSNIMIHKNRHFQMSKEDIFNLSDEERTAKSKHICSGYVRLPGPDIVLLRQYDENWFKNYYTIDVGSVHYIIEPIDPSVRPPVDLTQYLFINEMSISAYCFRRPINKYYNYDFTNIITVDKYYKISKYHTGGIANDKTILECSGFYDVSMILVSFRPSWEEQTNSVKKISIKLEDKIIAYEYSQRKDENYFCIPLTNREDELIDLHDNYKIIIEWGEDSTACGYIDIIHKKRTKYKMTDYGSAIPVKDNRHEKSPIIKNVTDEERKYKKYADQGKFNIQPETECVISYNAIENGDEIGVCERCNNKFHKEVLAKWLAKSRIEECPYCKNNGYNCFIYGKAILNHAEITQVIVVGEA